MGEGWSDGLAAGVPAEALLAALAQVGLAVLALDSDGRAVGVNAAVSLGDGLELVASRLRASHPEDQRALDAAIRQAISADAAAPPRVALRRPSGRRPLLVGTLPLPGTGILMVITDLDDRLPPEVAELQQVFGLTRREAEFAAMLATGMPPDDAAAKLRISRLHARQRLKTLFRKTDTHRQGELVALLAKLRIAWRVGAQC